MESSPRTPEAPAPGAAARLGAWATVLLIGILALNTAGGWVRLSGSGVAIPHWPLIELADGKRTLLPPFSARDWQAAYEAWQAHQQRLAQRVAAGELPALARGRQPADLDEFRAMFLIEWFHRLLAALVGLLALSCLGTALAQRALRARVGGWFAAALILIGVQAWLGAALIAEGTGTRWLFLHQGNAALIAGCVLLAILRLVDQRHELRALPLLAAALAWLLLVSGGLLAGSRHLAPPAGPLGLDAGPLWWPTATLAANLLDNGALHHLVHRLAALLLIAAILAAWWQAARQQAAERVRLALAAAATFAVVEAMLGLASATLPRGAIIVPLAHQFLGHVLFLTLLIAACAPRPAAADAGA
ncbi:MAG: COX15/CtaA family protein [Planctomycetota bacterium]|nr:COX15/CtaA family protein [Planctomycetota bacterium]